MRYIVREAGKTGGTEFDNPDDAIHAAAEWDFDTRRPCEIYMRWQFISDVTAWIGKALVFYAPLTVNGNVLELHSIPHTMEARAMTAAWRIADLSELERCFDALS